MQIRAVRALNALNSIDQEIAHAKVNNINTNKFQDIKENYACAEGGGGGAAKKNQISLIHIIKLSKYALNMCLLSS